MYNSYLKSRHKGAEVIPITDGEWDELLNKRFLAIIRRSNSHNLPLHTLRSMLGVIAPAGTPSNDEGILDRKGIFSLAHSRKKKCSYVWGICDSSWIVCELDEGFIKISKDDSPKTILDKTGADPFEILKWLDSLIIGLARGGNPKMRRLIAKNRREEGSLTTDC